MLKGSGIITALGGWAAVLLGVDGIAMERSRGGNCLHYNARLVTRCDSAIDQQIRVIDPTRRAVARAHELLGKRVPGGGGGTITRLATGDAA